MATATLELVNPYSKLGLKRRPTYDEIINLIDENETITGKLPDRTATFYKASPEGSFFDGTDHLEILKEQQNRILEREMRGILMRQNARVNGRTFNVDRIQSSSSSGTATPAEVQADNGGMVSAQIQTELEARARRETSRQQALFETHRDEVQRQGFVPTIQSFFIRHYHSNKNQNTTHPNRLVKRRRRSRRRIFSGNDDCTRRTGTTTRRTTKKEN